MKSLIRVLGISLCGLLAWSMGPSADAQDAPTPRKIKRVKRPEFKPKDWDGVYFPNLFTDGLVGPRPSKPTAEQLAKQSMPQKGADTGGGGDAGQQGWSKWISRGTLENEVKTIQQNLARSITTPGKFKTGYAEVHQSFSMLSMLFAIIRTYDQDVRWKEFAGPAQASFERAAANSRVGTIQAYESCKRRNLDLQDMVRGGNFNGTDKAPESLDWAQVVDHSPIMEQLEVSYEQLKQFTASNKEFKSNREAVLHHAELIAAMSEVVQQPGMEYAEEEGYVDYAKIMRDAAINAAKAVGNEDFASAETAVNTIGQTCSNCHEDWR